VVVAVMGVNSRGAYLAKCYSQLPNVEVAYICDVEDGAIQNGLNGLKDAPRKPVVYKDIRKLLNQKDFDALIIATPDHWHTPMAIMAMAAGKHVYLEKPCSQNPYEGELLLKAVNKYQRIVQMGAQRRSSAAERESPKRAREVKCNSGRNQQPTAGTPSAHRPRAAR